MWRNGSSINFDIIEMIIVSLKWHLEGKDEQNEEKYDDETLLLFSVIVIMRGGEEKKEASASCCKTLLPNILDKL